MFKSLLTRAHALICLLCLVAMATGPVDAQSMSSTDIAAATNGSDAQSSPDEAAPAEVTVTFLNTGPVDIDLFYKESAEHAEAIDAGVSLGSGFDVVLSLVPGWQILALDSATATVPDRQPFYTVNIGADADGLQVEIPDMRLFQPVLVSLENILEVDLRVSRTGLEGEEAMIVLGELAPGKSTDISVYPRTEILIEAKDGTLVAKQPVSFEPEQVFDLKPFLAPTAQTAEVTINNYSDQAVAIDEVSPTSLLRVAIIEGGTQSTIKTPVGLDLKFYDTSETPSELGSYRVEDAPEQSIAITDATEDAVLPSMPGVDPSKLPERFRANAVKFLANTDDMFAERPDVMTYVVYNDSDKPIWYAGYGDGQLKGVKQVRPGFIGNIIAKVGDRSIAWPDDVVPGELVGEDIYLAVNVSKDMPRIVNVTPPEPVRFSLRNGVCKPVDIFAVNPLGFEIKLATLDPMQADAVDLEVLANMALIARAGRQSVLAGQKIWSGVVGDRDGIDLAVDRIENANFDPMDASIRDESGDVSAKSVRVYNTTSRPIEVYVANKDGRELLLNNGLIAAGSNFSYTMRAGDVMILRRPDVKPALSEYGRYRVTTDFNQSFDTADLAARIGTIGSWIDLERAGSADNNEVGTVFLNLRADKDGKLVGSSSYGDEQHKAPSSYYGCADELEAFGQWTPAYNYYLCDDGFEHTGPAAKNNSPGGYFHARRVGKRELVMTRGACTQTPHRSTSWYNLPLHYDDMEPSKQAFETGMFNLAWAPKSFDWLGRGYNLLRTDPLDYGSTENGINSDRPLFRFIYEDAAGVAAELTSKKVFGVDYSNQNGRSDSCDKDEKMVKSRSDLEDFASKSYSGSVGVPGVASFSLSKSHQDINTASTGKENLYILERCDARLHKLITQMRWIDQRGVDMLRQPLDIGFRNAVNDMPLVYGDGRYLRSMVLKYGTHFAEDIVYGGTFFAETQVDKKTYQLARQEGETLSLEASGTLKKVQLGGSYASEETSKRDSENANSNTTYRKWSVGGTQGSVYSDWSASVEKTPAPIDIKFRPVNHILTPVFFPEDPFIGQKNHLLDRAIRAYFREKGVPSLTSDPRNLDVIDPKPARSICYVMDVLEVDITEAQTTLFGGGLLAGFADANKRPIRNIYNGTLTMNVPANGHFSRTYDNLGAWVASAGKFTQTSKVFTDDSTFVANPTTCTPMVSDDYINRGYLYMHGALYINDGAFGRRDFSSNFPEMVFPLAGVQPGKKQSFEKSFVMPGGNGKVLLTVWVNGTVE